MKKANYSSWNMKYIVLVEHEVSQCCIHSSYCDQNNHKPSPKLTYPWEGRVQLAANLVREETGEPQAAHPNSAPSAPISTRECDKEERPYVYVKLKERKQKEIVTVN